MGSLGVSVRCMACESAIFERRRRSDRRTVKYGIVDIVDGVWVCSIALVATCLIG